jgi:hypothetical protein
MERVRFVSHLGTPILFIDGTNCNAEELCEIFDEVRRMVTAEPENSVLTLGDFTGSEFDKSAADHMKLVAAYDRPYVKRAALVGAEALRDVYYNNLLSFSARDFPVFKTREEAMDWLVEEPAERAAS